MKQKMNLELFNGHFIDVKSGQILDGITSLTIDEEGRIALLSKESQAKEGIEKIDLKGHYVIPGLFNTHAHTQLVIPSILAGLGDLRTVKRWTEKQREFNLKQSILHGITHIRDAWAEDLRQMREWKKRRAQGEMLPRLYQSVLLSPEDGTFAPKQTLGMKLIFRLSGMPLLDYEDEHCGTVVISKDAERMEIEEAIEKAIEERGADYIKLYDQREKRITYEAGARLLTQKQLDLIVEIAHQKGMLTTMHHVTAESFIRGTKAGVHSLVHLPFDRLLTDEEIESAIQKHLFLEPTLSLLPYLCFSFEKNPLKKEPRLEKLNSYREEHLNRWISEAWIPELQPIVKRGFEKILAEKFKLFGVLDMIAPFRYFAGLIGPGIENFQRLYRAGLPLATGNDAGAIATTPAMIHHEVEFLRFFLGEEDLAFSPADALKMATFNSALAMGLEKDFGSIEEGKIADLVVLERNPLLDFQLIGSRASLVFIQGQLQWDNSGK